MKADEEILKLQQKVQTLEDINQNIIDAISFLVGFAIRKSDKGTVYKILQNQKQFIPEWKPDEEYQIGSYIKYGTNIFDAESTDKQIYLVTFTHISEKRYKPGQEEKRPGMPAYSPVNV